MIEMSLRQSEPVALPEQPAGGSWRSVLAHMLLTTLMVVTGLLVFVPAVLFHCGLRSGRRAAWLTGIVTMAVAAALAPMAASPSDPDPLRMAWAQVAAFGLAVVLPSLAALPLVEQGVRFGRLLTLLLLGSTIGLAAVELGSRALAAFSPFGYLLADLRKVAAVMIDASRKNPSMPSGQLQQLERWMAYWTENLMPGFMLLGLTAIFVLSILMLGRLQAWHAYATRREDAAEIAGAYRFRNFAVPDWVLFAFIVGGLAPLTSGLVHQFAVNALFTAVVLYILQGLAVFRFVLAAIGSSVTSSMLGWTLFAFLILTTGLLVPALVGLFDPFFDFRHYKKRKDDSHESHSD